MSDDMFGDSSGDEQEVKPAATAAAVDMYTLLPPARPKAAPAADAPTSSAKGGLTTGNHNSGSSSSKRTAPASAAARAGGGPNKRTRAADVRPEVPARCQTQVEMAAAEDRGTRTAMEDVWVTLPDARPDKSSPFRVAFCGVFDGHGGRRAAEFAAARLHDRAIKCGLLKAVHPPPPGTSSGSAAPSAADQGNGGSKHQQEEEAAALGGAEAVPGADWVVDVKAAKAAVVEAFRSTDAELLAECAKNDWSDGATAVVAWILGDTLLVANVGDARAVLVRSTATAAAAATAANSATPATDGGGAGTKGAAAAEAAAAAAGGAAGGAAAGGAAAEASGVGPSAPAAKAITLTKEHKAIFRQERERIERAGGVVAANGRLDGRIEVSRAFGDRAFKKRGLSATPDVAAFRLSPEKDVALLLACDGFFTVFGADSAAAAAADALSKFGSGGGGAQLEAAAAAGTNKMTVAKAAACRLINEAVRERRAKDNVTVVLARFIVQ